MSKRANKNNLFKKITYNKKIILFFLCLVLLIGAIITTGILLFGDKSEDVSTPKTIAYFYDGEKHDAPPSKEDYEIDVVHCDKAVGEWDNVKWNLTLKEIEGKTTCVLNYKKKVRSRTLEVNPNGGTYEGSIGITNVEVPEATTYTLSTPTRRGFSLRSFSVESDSTEVDGNNVVMGDEDTIVTANWEINSYQVEIRDSYTCDKTVTAEYNQRAALCQPVRDGYTFVGWDTTSGIIEGNSLVVGNSDAIVTAKWTKNDYGYIVIHKQEALSGGYTIVDTETHNATYGTTVSPNTKVYTGFNTPEKTSITIDSNAENNKVQYLYSRKSYTLTINPGEGNTLDSREQELKFEESVEIQNPTREGYNFTGWTKTGGTLQDNVFTMGASNATLTANYRPKTMTLQFDANQGSVSPASKTIIYDQSYGELPTPAREGYTFTGWFVNGNKIESLTIVQIESITSAVAHWTRGSYMLSIDPSGGTYDGSTAITQEGIEYQAEKTINDPVREGYTFDGWNIVGHGATYDSNTKKFRIGTSNATLTARWTINKYKLTIQDSQVCDGQNDIFYQGTYNLCTPYKEGYTFVGWEDLDSIVNNDLVTMKAKNSTVTAKWVPNTYSYIVYHNKMNTDGTTYARVDADTYNASSEFGTVIVTEAKTYTGFKTQTNKTITIGVDSNVVNYNYEREKYTLTVNPGDGTYTGETPLQLYYEEQVTLPIPTKTGYDFSNWSKSGNATVIENTLTMGAGNTTLTANYQAKTFTITFNANYGSNTTNSMTVSYGQTYGTLPTAVRTDYLFDGWYTSASGGTKIESTTTVNLTNNQTLYAHWTENYAVFKTGSEVNQTMKRLAGNSSARYSTEDQTITGVERSTTLANTNNNVSFEGKPIYMWYDNGKIKWYSEASKVYFNKNSEYMFSGLKGVTSLNLSPYNSSKVTDMYSFFSGMSSLTSIDLSPLDTQYVNDMARMFEGTTNLRSIDLSMLNTSRVINMAYMFLDSGATSINFGSIDVSNVSTMEGMFYNMDNITSLTIPFNAKNLRILSRMFYDMDSLTNLNISSFNISNAKYMFGTFSKMNSIRTINLSNLQTQNIVNMSQLFDQSGFTQLDLSSLNTSKVQTMAGMFSDTTNLSSISFGNIDTSSVTNMVEMFQNTRALTNIDLSSFNTENVTNFTFMFNGATSITNLDLRSFNTPNLIYIGDCAHSSIPSHIEGDGHGGGSVAGGGAGGCGMFEGMTNLVTLDISSFDTSNVVQMSNLFKNLTSLKTIYVSNRWSTQSVVYSSEMFLNDTQLRGGSGTTYNSSYVGLERAHVDGGTSNPGYFTYKAAPSN